jgi:hypothetical protein
MGGGPPCQGNPVLNLRRRSLNDDRSLMPMELQRLVHECRNDPVLDGIPLLRWLENFTSMEQPVLELYNDLTECAPVHVPAESAGVNAIGCTGLHPLLVRSTTLWSQAVSSPPPGVEKRRYERAGVTQLVHTRQPIPGKVHWEAGFPPLFSASDDVQGQAKAMFPFTR